MLQCYYCDYTRNDSDDLKAHSQKHKQTGEILLCQYCEYSTAYFSALKRHSREHTGNIVAVATII